MLTDKAPQSHILTLFNIIKPLHFNRLSNMPIRKHANIIMVYSDEKFVIVIQDL